MQEERKKLLDSILEESNKMVIEKTWPVTEDELVEHSGISGSFEFGFLCGFLHCKKQMIRKDKDMRRNDEHLETMRMVDDFFWRDIDKIDINEIKNKKQ